MKYNQLLLAAILGLATAATTTRHEFQAFKAKYGKEYATPQEEEYRFKIFQVPNDQILGLPQLIA